MSFVVDVVSEDSFYENLTLGLIHVLANTPGVNNIFLEKRLPCERMLLTSWEQRHCCTLPEDMRQFYSSTDGFKLTWSYEYAGEDIPIGKLIVNKLEDLLRLGGIPNDEDDKNNIPTLLNIEISNKNLSYVSAYMPKFGKSTPHFGTSCKIFELDPCDNIAKVCLVYDDYCENSRSMHPPKIWLMDRCLEWHFLANDFTQYFRMMLVHQGLPQWQFRFTPMGVMPWAEHIFQVIAPHLLDSKAVKKSFFHTPWDEVVAHNKLNTNIFENTESPEKPIENGDEEDLEIGVLPQSDSSILESLLALDEI